MMTQRSAKLLWVALGLLAFTPLCSAIAAEPQDDRKSITLELGKLEEREAKEKLGSPDYGYVGLLGSFVATTDRQATALIVVHQHPENTNIALGRTKLTYEGTRRLGNVDGWVFKTEWDGKADPSRIFFSSERVYFGGGMNAYIAADYREATGWVWKLHPLRRMRLLTDSSSTQ